MLDCFGLCPRNDEYNIYIHYVIANCEERSRKQSSKFIGKNLENNGMNQLIKSTDNPNFMIVGLTG